MSGYTTWRDSRRRRLDEQAELQQRLETSRAGGAVPAPGRMEDPRWSAVQALVVSALLTIGVLGSLAALLVVLNRTDTGPESSLSLIFVAAAVVLILVVCTLTIVLKRLRLTNAEEPMGLPRGSIRAVIALLLILLFFIAAVFLFNSTLLGGERTANRTLNGIDAARYGAIPTDQIVSATPRATNTTTVYDVVLYPSSNGTATSDDLAKQLVTTLATLVTAVAAFYFGANSVRGAIKDATEETTTTTTVTGSGPGGSPPTRGGNDAADDDDGESADQATEDQDAGAEPPASAAPVATSAVRTVGSENEAGGHPMSGFDSRPGDELSPRGEGFDDFPDPDLDEADVVVDDIHERNPDGASDDEDRP